MDSLFWAVLMLALILYIRVGIPSIKAWWEARKFRKEMEAMEDFEREL